ncbi:MAG: hypothetical protein EOO02_25165 [Chitinophagaceae bacterium]|nr:MAG: hypothetical protein EOO02_25165 [Chitinophagaceae bacterium]
MKNQDSGNHVKYYPLHHFIFYPAATILLVISIRSAFSAGDEQEAFKWWVISAGIFLISWLSFMMRQHYALILQDRVVRMEMRFRYFALTGKRLESFESVLGFARIAALRFASDEELPSLLEKTIAENLGPSEIKKLIRSWTPDHMRV